MTLKKFTNYHYLFKKTSTPIHLAIENEYMYLAEKLIESSANLDLQDSSGRYFWLVKVKKLLKLALTLWKFKHPSSPYN